MKAILIDSINKEVKEIEIGKGIEAMYEFLKCQYFTIGKNEAKVFSMLVMNRNGYRKDQRWVIAI